MLPSGDLRRSSAMTNDPALHLDRRSLVIKAAVVSACLIPRGLTAAELVPRPGQTEGPFYPIEFPPDMDNDLVKVTGQATQAVGQVIHISGRVLDTRGQPRPGSVVEIWQCDAKGIYRHPRAGGQGASIRLSRAMAARPWTRRANTGSAPSGRCRIPAGRRTSILPYTCRGRDAWSRRCTLRASLSMHATGSSTAFVILRHASA